MLWLFHGTIASVNLLHDEIDGKGCITQMEGKEKNKLVKN